MTTYNLQSDEFFANPYPTYALMRRNDPLYWAADMNMWILTRHADVHALAASRGASAERIGLFLSMVSQPDSAEVAKVRDFFNSWLVFVDAPKHTRIRSLVSKVFSPRSIAGLEPFIRELTDRALTEAAAKGSFDMVDDVGFPIPARVITHMLGVPAQDFDQFQQWAHDVLAVPGLIGDMDANVAKAYQSVKELEEYFGGLIADRRGKPARDLLGVLVNAEEDGAILSEQELNSTCALLLVAGHETTTKTIANSVFTLLRHPDQLRLLREEPELIDSATEELLRFESITGAIGRISTEDIPLPSGVVPAGQLAMGMGQSCNRDEAVFPEPDRFDIRRTNNRHLSFGHGPHVCLGAALARLETRIVIGEIVRRFPNLTLTASSLEWARNLGVRGLLHLPVST